MPDVANLGGACVFVEPAIFVTNQTLRGDLTTVTVDNAFSHGPGWLVIHEDDAGAPGTILGQTQLLSGLHDQGTDVTLSRDIVDGETLHAMLHFDLGTVGTFEPGTDAPMIDFSAEVVVQTFVVTIGSTEPTLSVSDQTVAQLDLVVIDDIFKIGAGWAVVYDDNAGAPGNVLGFTATVDGVNNSIMVTLSRDIVDGETLWAVLHDENPVDAAFTNETNAAEDMIVMDSTPAPVQSSFVVNEPAPTPTITVTDQDVLVLTTVTIDEVFSNGDAWVVVYDDDGSGNRNAILGASAVVDGTNTNVDVTLNRDIVDGETLHALLHEENPADTMFTFETNSAEDVPVTPEVSGTFVVTEAAQTASVLANDFTVATATEVEVSQVFSVGAGWIAVYDDNAGAPGNFLGASAVVDGLNVDVAVTISRSIAEGETLWARLHEENPVDASFTYESNNAEDVPVQVAAADVQDSFVVSAPAPTDVVTANDHTLTVLTSWVTVANVTLAADGWVVIHDDNAGAPGAILGQTFVAAGTATDVVVELSAPATDGATYWAMLHTDSPADATFTFGTASDDLPVTDFFGTVVMDSMVVTIDADTPDIRVTLSGDATDYTFSTIEPTWADTANDPVTAGQADGTMTLTTGTRYEFVNSSGQAHPIEFGDLHPNAAQNAQDIITHSMEAATDPAVELTDTEWNEIDGSTVRFTPNATWTVVDGYRCFVHRQNMRGTVTIN